MRGVNKAFLIPVNTVNTVNTFILLILLSTASKMPKWDGSKKIRRRKKKGFR